MSLELSEIARFRRQLLDWYQHAKRDLPWRRNQDPYSVWVSEIMLQQTRVSAVIPFYERFLRRFPDYASLAQSPESDLLAHWAGLGYYYRARNMQKAAQLMVEQGGFPSTYEGIRALPGVGEYTAAAVGSISFNLPHAVVDGNVFRVLSRVDNDPTDIASTLGRKRFTALAETLLDRRHPGDYNQAMMELGATVCLPKNPQCLVCPVADLCLARQHHRQNELPVKSKLQKSVEEHRTLFWIEEEDRVLLWQRPPDAKLMPGFWELPEQAQLPDVVPGETIGSFRHGITIHNYSFTIRRAAVPANLHGCQWVKKSDLLEQTNPTEKRKGKQAAQIPLSTVARKAERVVLKGNAPQQPVLFAKA
jgi:A/G-specific adenine glycosylase